MQYQIGKIHHVYQYMPFARQAPHIPTVLQQVQCQVRAQPDRRCAPVLQPAVQYVVE